MFRKYLGGNKKLGSSSIVKCKGGKKTKQKTKRSRQIIACYKLES